MPSIAIIGASPERSKFGNKAVRAYASRGWTVYPVHPKADQIEGLPARRTIAEVPPGQLDRVSLYLPPTLVLTILPQIAQRTVGELWLNPGTESPEVLECARKLGLNVVAGCSIVDIGVDPHHLTES